MHSFRSPLARFAMAVGMVAVCMPAAADEAVPLNDYTRLGQRVTATRPIIGVWVTVPSWSDSEGGLTLTLWDSPERGRRLASVTLTSINDNARVELHAPRPLPQGVYYWEVSDRTGTTRIGLYCRTLPAPSTDCAYFDDKPEPLKAFVSGTMVEDFVRVEVTRLREILVSQMPDADKQDACRALASQGDATAVPVLASLLGNARLAHMARYALQAIPGREADEALRQAAERLEGDLLVGVLNSIGARRDPRAARLLTLLLRAPDASVASAAAAALGRIATAACASALTKQLDGAPGSQRATLEEACLECARGLVGSGDRRTARALYDRLCSEASTAAVRRGALIGAITVRGLSGVDLALDALRSSDPDRTAAARWCVQRDLPGRPVTAALAASLRTLPTPARIMLIDALGARGDVSAVRALEAEARGAERGVRLAALAALARLGASEAAIYVDLLRDPDPSVASAAAAALASLPRPEVERSAEALLKSSDSVRRLRGIALASEVGLTRLAGSLLQAARGTDSEVSLAALRALRDLGGSEQFSGVVDLLASTQDASILSISEEVLVAICGRLTDPTAMAPTALGAHRRSRQPQRLALLRVMGACGGPTALGALVEDLRGPDAAVSREAASVLCAWRSPDAAPALLELARTDPAAGSSLLAVRALLRLAADPDTPVPTRLGICREAGPLVQRADEVRLLLSALNGIHDVEAARLVIPHLRSDAVRVEAGLALLGISEQLPVSQLDAALCQALDEISRWGNPPEAARRARELIAKTKASERPNTTK